MKTSVLIPCTPEHFIYLHKVIYSYLEGTKQPLEIIVVLSQFDYVPKDYVNLICTRFNKILKLVGFKEPLFTGAACALGEKYCTGDIIMIQAADDLPHHKRVEIVESYFEKYDIVALNHSYYGLDMMDYYGIENLENRFDYSNIKVVQPWEMYKHYFEDGNINDVYGQNCNFHVAAGTICYRRDIVGKFTWSNKKNGQDTVTCKRILHHFKKSIVINAPLYYYFK